jgi:alpha-D-xyloside xylohydrolase
MLTCPRVLGQHLARLTSPLLLIVAQGFVVAAPLALLDRNGSHVSVEAYAPDIVRITLSIDKDQALEPPGFGIIAATDATGWKRRKTVSGDEFLSGAMSLQILGSANECQAQL